MNLPTPRTIVDDQAGGENLGEARWPIQDYHPDQDPFFFQGSVIQNAVVDSRRNLSHSMLPYDMTNVPTMFVPVSRPQGAQGTGYRFTPLSTRELIADMVEGDEWK